VSNLLLLLLLLLLVLITLILSRINLRMFAQLALLLLFRTKLTMELTLRLSCLSAGVQNLRLAYFHPHLVASPFLPYFSFVDCELRSAHSSPSCPLLPSFASHDLSSISWPDDGALPASGFGPHPCLRLKSVQ
jgi:hypothetical protein